MTKVNDSRCYAALMILALMICTTLYSSIKTFINLHGYLLTIMPRIKWIIWCSSLYDGKIYRGFDCGNDHFLLIAEMQLKFKRLKQAEKEKKIFNTAKLKYTNITFRY